jgi:hypothetical protein
MSPDEICSKYFDKGVKITITVDGDMVYLKGDKLGLEFLGNLILAQSKFNKDDGFFISPNNAGRGLFNRRRSSHGIYILKEDKIKKGASKQVQS